jgi:hypothetical protein
MDPLRLSLKAAPTPPSPFWGFAAGAREDFGGRALCFGFIARLRVCAAHDRAGCARSQGRAPVSINQQGLGNQISRF